MVLLVNSFLRLNHGHLLIHMNHWWSSSVFMLDEWRLNIAIVPFHEADMGVVTTSVEHLRPYTCIKTTGVVLNKNTEAGVRMIQCTFLCLLKKHFFFFSFEDNCLTVEKTCKISINIWMIGLWIWSVLTNKNAIKSTHLFIGETMKIISVITD